eukprot:3548228-Ditylum_brightwellii.AAC.1
MEKAEKYACKVKESSLNWHEAWLYWTNPPAEPSHLNVGIIAIWHTQYAAVQGVHQIQKNTTLQSTIRFTETATSCYFVGTVPVKMA